MPQAMNSVPKRFGNGPGVPFAVGVLPQTDIDSNQGSAIRKRDDTHKMAQANRAFAHFRW